jgi:hypothetical protein
METEDDHPDLMRECRIRRVYGYFNIPFCIINNRQNKRGYDNLATSRA